MEKEKKKQVTVLIPTYNEKENIEELIQEILNLSLDFDLTVLVADDDSPDGTGEIVQKLSQKDKRVQVLVRKKRRGRGAGGIDGFKAVLKLKPDYVVEMDGDFSHQPRFIPLLLDKAEKYDLVIGSRFIKGGKDLDRNFIRKMITLLVRKFIRHQFRIPIKDVSSGFRCFKKEVLERIDLDDLISVGPSVVLETLYKAYLMDFEIGEVPIVFVDRKKGKTKLNLLTLIETLIMALKFKKLYTSEKLSSERI
ncbi:MAG: glycosyltransferase [Candidatus Aminicenantes bacterium]|nr:glycosyltransferase [Candidatus Aminicenantes bacterium]